MGLDENTMESPLESSAESAIPIGQEHEERMNRILELALEHRQEEISVLLNELHEPDIAYVLEHLDQENRLFLFHLLERKTQGLVLNELNEPVSLSIIATLSSAELADIIQDIESSEARYLLSDLDLNTISEILSRIPLAERINVTELLSYPEYSAGSIMSKEFAAVHEKDTVKKAIQTLRKIMKETDDIHTVFVIDDQGIYRGHIEISRLVLASPGTRVKRIMRTELMPIPVAMDQEEAAHFFTRYDFITLPVVDNRGVMLGRITVDDILEVVQEEASEDILRMGGVGGEETLVTPVIKASMRRIIWLLINMITAFLASYVVSLFKSTIGQVVILAALMPIVAGMGGNAAGQTMAVIIRNLALGELTSRNKKKAIIRELAMGGLNGLTMGSVAALTVYLVTDNLVLAGVISTAMFCNMIIAATMGTIIPLVLKRLKVDPAIASSIFVTTATDVLGFFIFLGLATLTLPFLL